MKSQGKQIYSETTSVQLDVEDTLVDNLTRHTSSYALLKTIFNSWVFRISFFISFVVFGLLYSFILPYEFTQQFSFSNWSFLNTRLIIWLIVLSISMSAVISLQIFAIGQIDLIKKPKGGLTAFSFVGSVLPNLLCCSPFIATLLSLLGFSGLSLYNTDGTFQHFFATWQTEFFVGSLVLNSTVLIWGFIRISKSQCCSDICRTPNISENQSEERTADEFIG
jgi:hypothetical protein